MFNATITDNEVARKTACCLGADPASKVKGGGFSIIC